MESLVMAPLIFWRWGLQQGWGSSGETRCHGVTVSQCHGRGVEEVWEECCPVGVPFGNGVQCVSWCFVMFCCEWMIEIMESYWIIESQPIGKMEMIWASIIQTTLEPWNPGDKKPSIVHRRSWILLVRMVGHWSLIEESLELKVPLLEKLWNKTAATMCWMCSMCLYQCGTFHLPDLLISVPLKRRNFFLETD